MKSATELSTAPTRGLTTLLAALSAVGPFSTDAYLPSMNEIGRSLDASQVAVQWTLSAYMIPYAAMILWHGAISDAVGRRKVVLVSLAAYATISILATAAPTIELLLLCRVLQGVTAGAGVVVGRAIVRDLYDGAAAQRLMSQVSLTFAIAPAIAPIIGGWLQELFGWRTVFGFLAAYGVTMWWLCYRNLPETLPSEKRQPLHPSYLAKSYIGVAASVPFMALALASTLAFVGFFLYVSSASMFMTHHLGVPPTGYVWLFGPITGGLAGGAWFSGRFAGKMSRRRTLSWAMGLMAAGVALNLVFSWTITPGVPWSVVPLLVFVLGTAVAFPTLSLMALDLFPTKRGLAASCMSFIQSGGGAAISVAAPLVWGSVRSLALAQTAILAVAGFALWLGLRTFPHRDTSVTSTPVAKA